MNTAILTGASGFVGRAVLRELLANGYKVYAVIREGRENTLPTTPNCIPVFCELAKISTLASKIPAGEDAVFIHLAWAGVSPEERKDTRIQLDNVQASVNAVRVAKELGCSRFIGAGSIMEHETLSVSLAQDTRPGMGYIYGAAKLASRSMCKALAVSLGIDFVWTTLTNVYGVGDCSERMVNTALQKCLRGEAPQFTAGTQRYDFIYIDDAALAIRLIAERGRSFYDYLVGSGNARPLREFLLEMQAAVAPELSFSFGTVPYTGVDLPAEVFDTSALINDVGFIPRISFAEGCRKTSIWQKEKLVQNS